MQDKSLLRSQLFQHLDGLVTAPVAYALWEKGVLDFLLVLAYNHYICFAKIFNYEKAIFICNVRLVTNLLQRFTKSENNDN